MMKRTWALVLSVCLLFGTLDCAAFAEEKAGPEALSVGSSGTGIRRAEARTAGDEAVGSRSVTGGSCGDGLEYELAANESGTYTLTISYTGSGDGTMLDYAALSGGTGNVAPWNDQAENITAVVIENGVVSIGSNAFVNCTSLPGVTLPESVTSIGEYAFYGCTALASINIPSGVTSISAHTFSNCTALTDITIPDGIGSIGANAFAGCSGLAHIAIPVSVTSVEVGAFDVCTALKNVTYGGTGTQWNTLSNSIGENNESLKNAAIRYEDGSFGGVCGSGLTWSLGADGALVISGSGAMTDYVAASSDSGDMAPWQNLSVQVKALEIESGVTSIGNAAFFGCRGLAHVEIPVSVTRIGAEAFSDCIALTNVTYRGTMATWENISIGEGNEPLTGAVILCNDGLLGALDSGTCGDSLYWRFSGNGKTLTITGAGDMYDYSAASPAPWSAGAEFITGIIFPDDFMTSIGPYAFYGCSGVSEITIPKSIGSIGESAFGGWDALTRVIYTGTEQEWEALQANIAAGNDKLKSVEVTWEADYPISGNFDAATGTLTISGRGNMEDYLSSADVPWQAYKADTKKLVIEDGITGIGMNAFSGFAALTQATIPESVKSIGESAFYGCGALNDVTYPGTKAQWAEQIAIDPTGNAPLTGATIHCSDGEINAGITYILHFDANGGDANSVPEDQTIFAEEEMTGANFLVSTKAPTREGHDFLGWAYTNTAAEPEVSPGEEILLLSEEPERTLYAVWALQTLSDSCGENLTWLLSEDGKTLLIAGTGAMDDYSEERPAPWSGSAGTITCIQLPEGMSSIGSFAFSGCSALQQVAVPLAVTSVGARAFGNCTALTELLTSEGLTQIDNEAFMNCPALKSVSLPVSLQTVGYDAFSGCDGLTDVYYAGTEAQWGELSGEGGGISSGNGALTGAAVHYSDSGSTDTPDTPQEGSLLQIDENLQVASGKELKVLEGIDIRVFSGKTVKISGSVSAAGKLQNEGTLIIEGQLQAAGGIESSGGLALSAGEITSSSARGTVCGESGKLQLSGGRLTNTGEGPALSLTGSAPAGWNISCVIRSKAANPVTLNGVPFLPDGYRVEQAADGFYYLRQN